MRGRRQEKEDREIRTARLPVRRKQQRTRVKEIRKLQQSVTGKSQLDYKTTDGTLEDLRGKNKYLVLS